jgi:hypothetical protein
MIRASDKAEDFIILKKYFLCGQCLYFFQHTNNAYLIILYTTALLCLPKNLIPWRDSNPGLLVPEADAMSTASRRRQGKAADLCVKIYVLKFMY